MDDRQRIQFEAEAEDKQAAEMLAKSALAYSLIMDVSHEEALLAVIRQLDELWDARRLKICEMARQRMQRSGIVLYDIPDDPLH